MTHNDRATTPGAAHRDAIAALTTGDIGRANLPAAITQGLAQPGGVPSPHLLSYAASVPLRPSVPLPVARPQFVAARLDRSNFRSLTGRDTGQQQHVALRARVIGFRRSAPRPALISGR